MPSAVLWSACIPHCVNFSPRYVIFIRESLYFRLFSFSQKRQLFLLEVPSQALLLFFLRAKHNLYKPYYLLQQQKHVVFSSQRSQVPSTTQLAESVSQKGWWICAKMKCFSKGTCQSPSDTPSLEKYLASGPSSRISPFVDSGKCLLFMYSDLLGLCVSKAFNL